MGRGIFGIIRNRFHQNLRAISSNSNICYVVVFFPVIELSQNREIPRRRFLLRFFVGFRWLSRGKTKGFLGGEPRGIPRLTIPRRRYSSARGSLRNSRQQCVALGRRRRVMAMHAARVRARRSALTN